ncbi:site-specific DNA-methyltransferase [Anaerorudis cellulosivorans]|uniref:site-specific DNA-methyltransferase n=1 Tax=Anaerorudis cellulosivorans TaxID=3397862 RepID=UPI00221E9C27|nr:site-specific DNA-methyltransferase [Seramator thermalis]MCW1734138.1 site-specific DNA-methyltransferase [Seramator thermalis]
MSNIEKLDLSTPDFVNENIEKIAAFFPNCVTETAEGKKIDFDLLQQELSHDIVEGNRERYRLEWPGKREAIVTANLPTTKTLRPVREDSVDFDNTENLYIEGDNLEVLKLLQESYFGKIKMIYIDPPYNTGNDFVYKDNFAIDRETELFESGQIDEYNQRLVANPETSGRYHSDWLTMMYPRLKLARNLLSDNGVIFISIDDHEVHNLRKICDEVLGEENFVAQFPWRKRTAKSDVPFGVSQDYEWVLSYARKEFIAALEGGTRKYYESPDLPNRPWRIHDLTTQRSASERPNSDFTIINPKNGEKYPANPLRTWAMTEDTFPKYYAENKIVFPGDYDFLYISKPVFRYFKDDDEAKAGDLFGFIPVSTNFPAEIGMSQDGTKDFGELFKDKLFSFPKPVELIKYILKASTNFDKDSIILDFFSGSATTAHAVMQLNAEDGGKRKYIMVQLPELTDEKSEAYKAGYKNICEIGKERIRRAANKIKEEKRRKAEKEGMFANGEDTQDYGFRVYRLDSSNMKDVYYRPQDYKQETLAMFADNIKPDRTADDLLTQVMLDWGLPLSYKIDRTNINGKQVFRVAQDSLLACFDTGIDEAFIKAIAKEKPLRVVFRDSGFADDTAKINVRQLLQQLSPETEMKVI